MKLFDKIYDVFGEDTPSRIKYNGTVASPTSTKFILKEYKTWKRFEEAYGAFCGTKHETPEVVTKPAKHETPEVVTKPAKPAVNKAMGK
jgi:hypothetical protein